MRNPLELGTYAERVLLDIHTFPQYPSDYNLIKIVRLQTVIESCLRQSVEDKKKIPVEDEPLNERISSWLFQTQGALNQDLQMPNSEFSCL
jgi:hypothetical protein